MQSRTAIPAEAVWVRVLNLENSESHDNLHICRVKEWCLPSIWGVTAGQTAVPCLRHSLSQCSSQRDPSKPWEHIIPHHIAFHELQIAQRTCENPHMTNKVNSPALITSLIVLLVPWSPTALSLLISLPQACPHLRALSQAVPSAWDTFSPDIFVMTPFPPWCLC